MTARLIPAFTTSAARRNVSSAGAPLVLSLWAVLLVGGQAAGQTIVGRVLDESRETPVSGAGVSLIDRAGEARVRTVTDSLGRFVLEPPAPGEYLVETVQLSYSPQRSPLFELSMSGRVSFEIMMTPLPLGLAGLEVEVEREAESMLGPFGLTPATLGQRWIDREDLSRMETPGLAKDVIRWQNIAGVWVEEKSPLCVRFRRRELQCALTVLDGVVIPAGAAFALDTRDIEAIAILTPLDATTFYGTAAGGGAVLVWTRQGRR